MSEKQWLYLVYLLETVGIDKVDINKYISLLNKHFCRYIKYPSGRWDWDYSQCINIIKEEIALKKYYSIELKSVQNITAITITATELSSFIFCPVSYSINKTFVIANPTNQQEIHLGNDFHLLMMTAKNTFSNQLNAKVDFSENEQSNFALLDSIRNSKMIYSGHKERKPFFNQVENFKGDPDYIFINEQNQKFIVEEKFTYKRSPIKLSFQDCEDIDDGVFDHELLQRKISDWKYKKVPFYHNHIMQLYSYIRNYPEQISHGYLIYWFYDYGEDGVFIHKYDIKYVSYTKEFEADYKNVKNNIINLINKSEIKFDSQTINHLKCIKCSVNKYCGHKNKRFATLTFPYKKSYLGLYQADFPDKLKKQ